MYKSSRNLTTKISVLLAIDITVKNFQMTGGREIHVSEVLREVDKIGCRKECDGFYSPQQSACFLTPLKTECFYAVNLVDGKFSQSRFCFKMRLKIFLYA